MVKDCLPKANGSPYVQKFDSFLKSDEFKELKEATLAVAKYLKEDAIIDEQKDILDVIK